MPPDDLSHIDDDRYLRIWEMDQRQATIRWTIATFFMGISFALFGLSFQTATSGIPRLVPLGAAVVIYWFTYLLFRRFHGFSNCLRQYLLKMESEGQTSLRVQTEWKTYECAHRKVLSASDYLLLFGVFYTAFGIVLGAIFP